MCTFVKKKNTRNTPIRTIKYNNHRLTPPKKKIIRSDLDRTRIPSDTFRYTVQILCLKNRDLCFFFYFVVLLAVTPADDTILSKQYRP